VDEILLDYEAPEQRGEIIRQFVSDVDVEEPTVGRTFPLHTARQLEEEVVEIQVAVDLLLEIRSQKTPSEISAMREVQRATDRAFRRIREILDEAIIVGNRIELEGQMLTVERLVQTAHESLQGDGCTLEHPPVIGCGSETADPHVRGAGNLRPQEPILIDMSPKDTTTGYHADTSRTFVKGEVPTCVEHAASSTQGALNAAIEVIEPGVSAATVDAAACGVLESEGYPTKRTHQDPDRGFLHYTGHGIGLDVHELPHCSPNGGILNKGQIITIEPGLYDPAFGGVRIEDSVLITAGGCEVLTQVDRDWRV
jgi:Xaa-Pro aminopeptidase